jgi:hypothetical protein
MKIEMDRRTQTVIYWVLFMLFLLFLFGAL